MKSKVSAPVPIVDSISDVDEEQESEEVVWTCLDCKKIWTVNDRDESWVECAMKTCKVQMHLACATTDQQSRYIVAH